MQQLDKIEAYVDFVCKQVRWKNIHESIGDELISHMVDQKNAFTSAGLAEEDAVAMTICEMGDPVIVGTQFDRIYRPKTKWSMILLTI